MSAPDLLRAGFRLFSRSTLLSVTVIAAVGFLGACSDSAVEETIEVFVPDDLAEMTDVEVAEQLAVCATDSGLTVTVTGDGGVDFRGSENNPPTRFRAVMERCDAELRGRGAIPSGPERTPEFLDAEYDRLLFLAECVTGEGHVVEEPPSREDFVASTGWNWHPYMLLGELGAAAFAEINEVCPQDLEIE